MASFLGDNRHNHEHENVSEHGSGPRLSDYLRNGPRMVPGLFHNPKHAHAKS